MLRKLGYVLALLFVVACFASPADAFDPSQITDWLKDKGKDLAKDKAKDAATDWLFFTGQSETMHAILKKAEDATGDQLSDKDNCRAACKAVASAILSDINLKWTGTEIAKLGALTAAKTASLGVGAGAALGEGAGLAWLSKQYTDGMTDSAIEKLQKLFEDEKIPEYELYEKSGKNGVCTYTLRAEWDILHGTYKVLIQGDCGCQPVGGQFVQQTKLGAWWMSFAGKVLMKVENDTITWLPQPATPDYDAQCECNHKTLKQAFTERVTAAVPQTAQIVSPPPKQPYSPLPASKTTCDPCKAELAEVRRLEGLIDAAGRLLVRPQGDYDMAQKRIDAAKASGRQPAANDVTELNEAQTELTPLLAKYNGLVDDWRAAVAKLKECEKKCGLGMLVPGTPTGGYYASLLPGFTDDVPQQPQYVANPGTDVAKNDVVLTDTSTQKEIPGGKVVIIPGDPKQPISPPILFTSTGTVTLPRTQPNDRIVFLPDNHAKIELTGGDLPKDGGERITVPERPLRLIVHDTPCGQVTDSMVRTGITDQYGVGLPSDTLRSWNCADYHFGTDGFARNDGVVTIPHYVPLKPGTSVTDGGTIIPKDGPTITDGGTVIEGDQPREIQGAQPSEPFASSQGSWGQAYADQWYLSAVHWLKPDKTSVLPEHGTPVTVAVIDTGVDFSHPELAAAKWVNPSPGPRGDVNGWNFVDNSADVRDFSGHGTIVAGIIAAASSEHKGIAGINPWARIMALKAMEIDGKGGSINLAQAVVYAADHGARVINMSVGGRTVTRTEQDAIDYATRRNALVVVASGNEGVETTNFSPAGLHNVLAVAAVGPDLKRQAFSNWGGTIGIAAPGVDILSLRARQTDLLQMTRREYKPGTAVVDEQYYRVTGSSFAAPMVSGAASLLLSLNPELTAVQVRRMLLQSARDMEAIGTNQFNGYGVLDIEAALAANPDHYAEAAISGVAAVQSHGAVQLRVTGTADADSLKDAHLEFGPGDNPTKWTVVARPLTKPVVNGLLADLPADAFRGGKQWTLRVVVQDRAGLRREARFKLTLG